jgi:hypothetical protein
MLQRQGSMETLSNAVLSQIHGGDKEGDHARAFQCGGSTAVVSTMGALGGGLLGAMLFHAPRAGAVIGAGITAGIDLTLGDDCANVTHRPHKAPW